jgi:hypothetical protein
VDGAHVLTFGDDGFGREFAFLELGTLGWEVRVPKAAINS